MNEPLLPITKHENHSRNKSVEIIKSGYWKSSLLWVPVIVCITILIIVDLIEIQSYSVYNNHIPHSSVEKLKKEPSTLFTIDQEGCRIPYLEENDRSIKQYIFKPNPINCTVDTPDIVTQTHNTIFIDARNYSSVKCCYRSFWRRNPKPKEKDTQYIKSSLCTNMENNEFTEISDEFIIVQCTIDNKKYSYFHSFVQKNKISDKLKLKVNNNGEYLSVLVIGLDAISRLNFRRQMPKTFNYLRKTLDAKEMIGYNKVGDNTFPNLMVVLNGMTDDEIEHTCLAETNQERFDKCPLVWKMFDESGYITAFGEDATYMGLFTYSRKGFFNPPTDFDYRVFDQLAEDEIGHNHLLNSDLCLGNDLRITKLLQYIKDFATTFKKHPYFGFFWGVSMSHDYLNHPCLTDEMHYQLLKDLYESGSLKNTALFVMSDHGIRWGGIRSTYQGFLEERLPTLFAYTPQWFRDKYPSAWANLITNTHRLTTPFDLHETFMDLKNLNFLKTEKLKMRLKLSKDNNTASSRGLSLFLPISKERTCQMAAIPNHFCTCQSFRPLNVSLEIVQDVGQFVVDEMNRLLIGYKSCAELKLEQIISASVGITNVGTKEKLKHINPEYTVTLITTPGQGKFEASVRWNAGVPQLTGTISRINLYGTQSRCISDFHLKLYCYCQSTFR
ncbi:uncharacterized protein LOC123305415 [Chrysoperla carnea]|uniref:uncharacterized protein LOC123305415 n=1 Tax=Chrysoperla carnea TaxID=189513 RepID=UPI001D088A38|nr:uncharacterized protein LOC123305415 [Chrysoperla carnea]XP_044743059.1 uncharacterized protein LOC123305415 [Chrysoperla carnea]XP_044743060.1 uncharacterized protein LOC123305415 [Chrysoperla carnea]